MARFKACSSRKGYLFGFFWDAYLVNDVFNAFFAFHTTISQTSDAFGIGFYPKHSFPCTSLAELGNSEGCFSHRNIL